MIIFATPNRIVLHRILYSIKVPASTRTLLTRLRAHDFAEEVLDRGPPKSLCVERSFPPAPSASLAQTLAFLAGELAARLALDGRAPRQVQLLSREGYAELFPRSRQAG